MIKIFSLLLWFNSTLGHSVTKDGLFRRIKSEFCDCSTRELKREIDIQLFHEPLLKDSLTLFAAQRFDRLHEVMSFAKVKIIFRLKF